MDRKSQAPLVRGFSLIELLVVVALLAIAATVVAPDLGRWVQRMRLEGVTSELVAGLNRARGAAVTRAVMVSVCPVNQDGLGALSCGVDFRQGWLAFTDASRDQRYDPSADELLAVGEGLPAGYTVTDRKGGPLKSVAISYLPDGTARRALTHLYCAPNPHRVPPVSVVLSNVGRVRLEKGEGQCPAS